MKRSPIRKISKKRAKQLIEEKEIKKQIIERSNGLCEHCGNPPDWRGLSIHERIFRSHGGKVSLENSEARCGRCHAVDGHNLRESIDG